MNFKKAIFLWGAVMFITGGVFAQVKKKPAAPAAHKTTATTAKPQARPATAVNLPTDPDVIIGKLPNGLTYYVRKNSLPKNRANLILVTKAGSVLETDPQQGMANFIQRMAFKGTRDYQKDDMANYLKRIGGKYGPDTSAFATYDETAYQLSIPTDTDKLYRGAFTLMANWAAYITFNPDDINNERAKLAQEIAQGGKSPQARLQELTLPVLLGGTSRYAMRSPMGKESTVKTFTDASVKGFYSDWYRPDLQAIIAVGDFDPKQVDELIRYNFSSLRNPSAEKPRVQFSVPPTPGTTVKIVTDKAFPYVLAQVVSRHAQAIAKTPADYMEGVKVTLFNQMLNARISEITQSKDPVMLYGQASYSPMVGKMDAFSTLTVANPGGLETAFKTMAGEMERVRKFGFTNTELERAKQNALAQISDNFNAKGNSPSANYAGDYERNFLTGQAIPGIDYEYNYYINNIGKISVADMNALAIKLMADQNRVILIEANDSEKDKLPNEQTVLKWMADAGKGLTNYVDESATPLMPEAPVPGKVLSVKIDSALLVTTLNLSNGVKVILRPSLYINNQILFSGYSFGGTSLASDNDFTSANLAGTVISNSGVAGFNQTQLNRMLREKNLSVSPYISDITQGVSGYSTPADFESAMKLLYLYFTNPRKDAEVWKSTIAQQKSVLSHKQNDPGSVYQDTVLSVLNSYNPRALPATAAQLDAASLDKAYSFYKDRFADASGFTFTFSGTFAVDQIVPFVVAYLGGLPSNNSKETYKVIPMHPPAGQITKTVYKGAGDKATVQLVYSGAYEYNEANNIQLDGLEDVLNTRLSDSLKAGGIYSVGVRANYVKIPEGRYKMTISYLCDANKVDQSVDYMVGEINKIKQNGAVAKDVQLFINTEARNMQQNLRQNAYWQAALSSAEQNQQNPDRILNHMQVLETVTSQSVKDAANKYLNSSNFIKLILLPEKK
ncbi:MAG TPA: insulinase family protein [Mucilaginibacter sp.]|jgi:zinc protease|nr:insulinase family protein [Mucilaginibacter sp.]